MENESTTTLNPLTILAKSSIVEVWLGSQDIYAFFCINLTRVLKNNERGFLINNKVNAGWFFYFFVVRWLMYEISKVDVFQKLDIILYCLYLH